jgi:hypothetical protein
MGLRFGIALIVGALLGAVALGGGGLDLGSQTAKRIRYPVHDSNGQLQYEVLGDEARVLPEGLIYIVNPKLIFYEGGQKAAEISAPECYFDRERQMAASTASVCMVRAEMVLTGEGYEVSCTNKLARFTIHNRVKVILNLSVMGSVNP